MAHAPGIQSHAPASALWYAPTRFGISYGWELVNDVTLNGADVDTVGERYAGGNDLDFSGGRPLYEATGWDSVEPSCNLDGVNEFGRENAAAAVVTGTATDATFVIACQLLALPGATEGFFAFGSAGTTGFYTFQTAAAAQLQIAHRPDGGGATITSQFGTVADTDRHVFTLVKNSLANSLWVDGVADGSNPIVGSAAATTLDLFVIGAQDIGAGAVNHVNMRFALMWIFPSALTADEAVAVSRSAALHANWT